jgi:hypothetical protein
MNPVLNEVKPTETTKLKHTVIPDCGSWGVVPDFCNTRNGRGCRLLADVLKGPHETVLGRIRPTGHRLITHGI